jgi:cell division protein FtsN
MAQSPAGTPAAPGTAPEAPAGTAVGAAPAGEEAPPAPPPAAAGGVAPHHPPAPAIKQAEGGYAVQLGAFRSGSAAANKHWERLQKEYPQLLAGLTPKVVQKKTASGTLYRLQAGGASESHARKICRDLKAKSQPCVIVRAERG